MDHFKGKQFQKDVIIIAVGYYLRYNLSYRELQEMLYDRGIRVSHTTIYLWVQEYDKLLYQIWKKKNKRSFYLWKMDETYIYAFDMEKFLVQVNEEIKGYLKTVKLSDKSKSYFKEILRSYYSYIDSNVK